MSVYLFFIVRKENVSVSKQSFVQIVHFCPRLANFSGQAPCDTNTNAAATNWTKKHARVIERLQAMLHGVQAPHYPQIEHNTGEPAFFPAIAIF
jgi:hypothetical protein